VLRAEAHFLRRVDGRLAISGAAAQALASVINGFQPDVLMLPFMLGDHPSHRNASLLLAAACEGLALEPEVWAYQVYSAMMSNVVVDITAWRGAKSDLIRYYQSQLARRDWVNFSLGLNA
jgi:LmbE family N-acetylglucosaminyl deacetylase